MGLNGGSKRNKKFTMLVNAEELRGSNTWKGTAAEETFKSALTDDI